jgi:dipeptidyl aminopeptidase/acylaminoacyl peptidase
VVDYYGPTYLISFVQTPGYTSHASATSAESKLIGGAVLENKKLARNASPTECVTLNDAPFFIVHGTSDPVVPPAQSQLIHDKLVAKGVQSEVTFLPGAGHGGPAFTDAALLDRVAVFIRKAIAN